MADAAKWDDVVVNMKLLRGVFAYGFESPSPIQARAIPRMSTGKDLIAQAQSGTGKTGCFSVGVLNQIDESVSENQAIIMAPTRELAQQTHTVMSDLGKFMKNLRISLVIGGTSTRDCVADLTKQPHVIIGCPGRIYDMLNRGLISGNKVKVLVLDEADEMLSSGFRDQVYDIFQYLSNDTQVCLFSATLPDEVMELSKRFMREPEHILVKSEMLTLEGIQQFRVDVENDNHKFECIKDIFDTISLSQAIIYCNSVKRAQDLHDEMSKDGFPVTLLHGEMERHVRQSNYLSFKTGKHRVLISTNLTARGIDVQQVSTVINFDLTRDVHTYLHRIGRSGRWGRKGVSISFVTPRDSESIKEIERHYSTQISPMPEDWAKALGSI